MSEANTLVGLRIVRVPKAIFLGKLGFPLPAGLPKVGLGLLLALLRTLRADLRTLAMTPMSTLSMIGESKRP